MEPFKSRVALVSENMAGTLADVISQLLPQSKPVPPRLSESQCDAFRVTRSCSIKNGQPFEAAGSLATPLPTSRPLETCWLKRASLNHHMLWLVMIPIPLLLLVHQCSLVLPSIFHPDSTPMQLLRGRPWCRLNSAPPLVYASIFFACIPKHFCYMTSYLWFSQFRLLIEPLFSISSDPHGMLIVRCNSTRDWESKSEQWVYCLLMSTAIWASLSPERAPLGQHTVWKDKQLYRFDNRHQGDPSLTVTVCLWVFVRGHGCNCLSFLEKPAEQNGPNSRYTLHNSPRAR